MDDVERDLIIGTLGHTLGNRTHAATILGISIRALRNKLRDYAAQGVAVPPPTAGVAALRVRMRDNDIVVRPRRRLPRHGGRRPDHRRLSLLRAHEVVDGGPSPATTKKPAASAHA